MYILYHKFISINSSHCIVCSICPPRKKKQLIALIGLFLSLLSTCELIGAFASSMRGTAGLLHRSSWTHSLRVSYVYYYTIGKLEARNRKAITSFLVFSFWWCSLVDTTVSSNYIQEAILVSSTGVVKLFVSIVACPRMVCMVSARKLIEVIPQCHLVRALGLLRRWRHDGKRVEVK